MEGRRFFTDEISNGDTGCEPDPRATYAWDLPGVKRHVGRKFLSTVKRRHNQLADEALESQD